MNFLDNIIKKLGGKSNSNLKTTKLDEIIELLGGDTKSLKTNLIDEKFDKITELIGSGSGSGSEYNAKFDANLVPNYSSTGEGGILNQTLSELSTFDTSTWTSTTYLFRNCYNLKTIPQLDTSNVTNMNYMFTYCKTIKTIPLLDTSNVTSMNYMFNECNSLETIPKLNTKNVTNMRSMFAMCTKLKSLPQLDASKITDIYAVIASGYYDLLTDFGGFLNLGKAFTQTSANYSSYRLELTKTIQLTHDSLMNVINNLYDLNLTYDVANGGTLYTQSLSLGSTNKAKLTAEEIAIATNKGWTIS